MDSARICVVGSANMDLIWQGSHLPSAGETVSGGDFFSALGGKGANQASAAARLGAQVSFVGCVGNDVYGDEIKQDFSARGVDATFMRVIDAATTGTALINVDAAGENTIAVAPGANRHVTREQIEEAIEALRPEILVVGFEIGIEAASHALAIGHDRSLRTICNPSPIDLTDLSWILHSTTIVVNETEFEAYGGALSLLE
ncbi:MAG: ribokinase, partial [Acidimicrobiia bacterium]|nr:ribokinase [Acidimicrobiia bacterium]